MDFDLTQQKDVVAYMLGATDKREWNLRCDAVKRANNGYPDFWYQAIVLGGVAATAAKNWGGDAKLHITTF